MFLWSCSAQALSEAAAAAAVTLVGGSIPERSASRLYNTCLVYDSRGLLLAKHRKVLAPAALGCPCHSHAAIVVYPYAQPVAMLHAWSLPASRLVLRSEACLGQCGGTLLLQTFAWRQAQRSWR
jgi:hypothetical protein